MNRREFIRNVGIAGTATAAACTYDPKVPVEHVLPYVVQNEDTLPGAASYFSTLCVGCSAACGLVARAKEGRVVHVEGNPDHPNGPGLCVRGHFDLVDAYNPDRVAGPMAAGKAITWDDAVAQVVAAINAARGAGKTVAWLGEYRTGSVRRLLDEVASTTGLRRVHWDALGVETLLAASRAVFGKAALPSYQLADAHVIVSFGMDFLGTAFDAMHMRKGWARAKDPAHGAFVTRLVCIEPRVGATSSQADTFLAPNPGTEAQVAFAVARLVAEKTNYAGPAAGLVGGIDVAAAAQASGLSEEKLRQVADWIAAGPSVVLPGGFANAGPDAGALAVATLLVNEVAGNVGRSVVFGREHDLGPVGSYADVKALLEDARAGKIGVLFLDGLNPVYNLPPADAVADALAKVDVLVQLANQPNDSTLDKTLLLPTGTGTEVWGDASVTAGIHVLQQPAMTPLKDTRGLGDILLAVAKGVGGTPTAPAPVEGMPADPASATPVEGGANPPAGTPPVAAGAMGFEFASFRDYVRERWRRDIFPRATGDFEAFWIASLQRGGFFEEVPLTGAAFALSALPAAGAGLAGQDLALVIFPSNTLADGRWANNPWAQELPDPIATYNWTTWVELNPRTVERLGLREKDIVSVKTATGEIRCGFFASPGVREDTVAILLGNGHADGAGRYAKARGGNPMSLIGAEADATSGALATYVARAQVTRIGGSAPVEVASGNIDQDGRPIALVVAPQAAVENLTGAAASIVPIHHLPVDKRLTDAGVTDMFPEPQHPTYRFAMAIDTNVCNGCMACVIACNLENNIPFVGPDQFRRGRTMSWIRMNRFFEGEGEHPDVRYLPSLCQHCAHAPCEGVCPVLATYHNLDGLNAMIYNRCVGTRYCANNCPYTARRFNYHTWQWPESMHLMLNPDVTAREMGVMEKCTFCIQRTRFVKDAWRDIGETVPDAALQRLTACAAACPSDAIVFGNAKDATGKVAQLHASPRTYTLLGELNTKPGIRYMARVRHDVALVAAHGGGGHGGEEHGAPTDHGAPAGHETTPGAHGAEHKEG